MLVSLKLKKISSNALFFTPTETVCMHTHISLLFLLKGIIVSNYLIQKYISFENAQVELIKF